MSEYADFFCKATGYPPFPYQERAAAEKFDVIGVPTGCGKTEAVVVPYLWDRKMGRGPKRLVYCLPTRALVSQTVERIKSMSDRLAKNNVVDERFVDVNTLMGGDHSWNYAMHPDRNAVIVGTQDMLLSRALNRGYGTSPGMWPIEFGTLNNDCLWIFDEVQLMRDGLATSVQLDGFRNSMGTFGEHRTVWMSATVPEGWKKTPDAREGNKTLCLSKEDVKKIGRRLDAKKTVHLTDIKVGRSYGSVDAAKIAKMHQSGTVTLAIVNTVERAQSLYKELKKQLKDASPNTPIEIIHSRFRRNEKDIKTRRACEIESEDIVLVSTQVVEAGVDLSAKTLVTEVAPWPSLVQRFGRCNRRGEEDGEIYVIDVKDDAPYDEEHTRDALKKIQRMDGASASPNSLRTDNAVSYKSVLRRAHVDALFDTTPDFMGGHADISRYVRSIDNIVDVSVFWREWDGCAPPRDAKPHPDELCSVHIGAIKGMKPWTAGKVFRYMAATKEWIKIDRSEVRPGETVLVRADAGGYDELGWNPASKERVADVHLAGKKRFETSHGWVTLIRHASDVRSRLDDLLGQMDVGSEEKDCLGRAAILHDIGKAHREFQSKIIGKPPEAGQIWAKWSGGQKRGKIFRHEAVSAIIALSRKEPDLVAYLVMAHHGKVRVAMRHATSKEMLPNEVLGIPTDHDDRVPSFVCVKRNGKYVLEKDGRGDGTVGVRANMAQIGVSERRSWIGISYGLIKKYGVFRLAFLETLLRAADMGAERGSETP